MILAIWNFLHVLNMYVISPIYLPISNDLKRMSKKTTTTKKKQKVYVLAEQDHNILVFLELETQPCIFSAGRSVGRGWGGERSEPGSRTTDAPLKTHLVGPGSQTHAASDSLCISWAVFSRKWMFLRDVRKWGNLPHLSSLLALKLHESRTACLFQKWPWEERESWVEKPPAFCCN